MEGIKIRLKFNGEGEVRIQEGMVVVLAKGQTIDLPDEVGKKLIERNSDFEALEPQIKKIKTIKMEEKK